MNYTTISRKIWIVVFMASLAGKLTVLMPSQTVAGQHGVAAQKKLPEFEVASIRPSKQDGTSWNCYPGGKVTGVITLAGLIIITFELQRDQILNMPAWGESNRYAIVAIPPESSESSRIQYRTIYPSEEQRQMLQSLLIERFHLKFHREFRNEPAYLLSLQKKVGDMKLQPPEDEHMRPFVSLHFDDQKNFSLVVHNSSMSFFAREVGKYAKLNVLDRTGLARSFDFKVPFYYQEETDSDFGMPILAGLRDFGFNIKPKKMPIEHIVIDHIEQPSEN